MLKICNPHPFCDKIIEDSEKTMLGIIIAMQNEADTLLRFAQIQKEYTLCGKKISEGRAFGHDFTLVLAGVGKTNAAAAAMLAVCKLGADKLLNFGLAGGISPQAKIADIFRVTRAVQYDFDLSEVNGTPKGTLNEYASPYLPLADGQSAFAKATLATGDKLTGSPADIPYLLSLGANLRDMEGGAIAHVSRFTGVPLYAFKAVSNRTGENSVSEYREFTERALGALADNMQRIIKEIDG